MYTKLSGVLRKITPMVRQLGTWKRASALVYQEGVGWRGWFLKTGSLAAVVNDTWLNYNGYGDYVYIAQWRWITKDPFSNPIFFKSGTFSARLENRDDYASGYEMCVEGLVDGVWTRLLSTGVFVLEPQKWTTINLSGTLDTPVLVSRIRYGIHIKHFWDQANGACTSWEEFGTYVE